MHSYNPTEGIDWGTQVPGWWVTYYFFPKGQSIEEDDGNVVVTKQWTPYERAQVAKALELFSNVAHLTFAEATSPASGVFFLAVSALGADSYLGVFGPPATGDDAGVGIFNIDGRGWDRTRGGGLEVGGYGFVTLIHELGHGLGLAHPHDTGGGSSIFPGVIEPYASTGWYDLNQGVYTMMSYVDGWFTAPHGRSPSEDYGWIGSPMAFDIAVLQAKYGANLSHRTGNDIYVLPDENAVGTYYSCIWDAGGWDTIVYRGSRDATINLNAATLEFAPGGGGWISYAAGIHGGFTIANGVVIEGARGGSGSDTIIGNAVGNLLLGGAGDDTVRGNGGADTLRGGEGRDWLGGGAGHDSLLGGLDADTLIGGAGNDFLEGGPGADVLRGGAGNDTLVGGGGLDRLIGGDGADTFRIIGPRSGRDRIEDFSSGVDVIEVLAATFDGLTPGELAAERFAANAGGAATEAFSQLCYDTTTGQLFWDANGTEAGGRTLIAVLSNAPVLTASDIMVIA